MKIFEAITSWPSNVATVPYLAIKVPITRCEAYFTMNVDKYTKEALVGLSLVLGFCSSSINE